MKRACPKCYSIALEIKSSNWYAYDGEWIGEPLDCPLHPTPYNSVHCMHCDWYGEDQELIEVDRR